VVDHRNNMKQSGYFFFVFFFVSTVGCCQGVSDTNQARATTASDLNRWESYIKLCRQYAFPIENCESIDEAVSLLKKHKLFDLKDDEVLLKQDYWGRKYHWLVKKEPNETTIRILSAGRNGVFENGDGDDIFFEIVIPNKGAPLVRPAVW
jgi:hypothetical protein